VMLSNFRLRRMIRAAALRTFCKGWTLTALTRWRTLLQYNHTTRQSGDQRIGSLDDIIFVAKLFYRVRRN